MKFYAGIVSRETPPLILEQMTMLAFSLESAGYCLRSGGASGADEAFEYGADTKEIFFPWPGFAQCDGIVVSETSEIYFEAEDIAKQVHPAWRKLTQGGRRLHTRNVFQVLGRDLETPSRFVVAWTRGGKLIGGTATALSIAMNHNIPIFNLADGHTNDEILAFANS